MNRLVFHIGPGKCGSTSIQLTLAAQAASNNLFAYSMLDPKLVIRLERTPPSEQDVIEFKTLVSKQFQANSTVVLSHEHIFQRVASLAKMVDIARDYANEISIVGYSRRPSGFLQSSYCQWMFCSPERTKETWGHLVDGGFAPELFSGLERHFVAAVLTGFQSARQLSGHSIVNWKTTYDRIEWTTAPLGAKLSVGTINKNDASLSLVDDFSRRSGLELVGTAAAQTKLENHQIDLDLAEATQLAILSGFEMPRPNQRNGFFGPGSALMPTAELPENALLEDLKACVDLMLWASNKELADKFGFDSNAMRPRRQIGVEDALSAVRRVQDQRQRDPSALLAERTRIAARLAKLSIDILRQR